MAAWRDAVRMDWLDSLLPAVSHPREVFWWQQESSYASTGVSLAVPSVSVTEGNRLVINTTHYHARLSIL